MIVNLIPQQEALYGADKLVGPPETIDIRPLTKVFTREEAFRCMTAELKAMTKRQDEKEARARAADTLAEVEPEAAPPDRTPAHVFSRMQEIIADLPRMSPSGVGTAATELQVLVRELQVMLP